MDVLNFGSPGMSTEQDILLLRVISTVAADAEPAPSAVATPAVVAIAANAATSLLVRKVVPLIEELWDESRVLSWARR